MQIKSISKQLLDRLEENLSSHISREEKTLYEAARYAIGSGGKRIRPLLVLLTCYDLCQEVDHAFDAASSLEFVHNYTLVHDDLPCMDDDDLRRGKLTVHKAFDEATAVLCGDFLLTESFAMISQSPHISNDQKVELIKLLSYYSGGQQLLEGQLLDLQMGGKNGHIYELLSIYMRKTSSLFCCALEFGAILANRYQSNQKVLREVGQKIGWAFQIQNDFLGKHKDEKCEKFTIFSLKTDEEARSLIEETVQEALLLLNSLDCSFPLLIPFLNKMFSI